MRRGPLLKRETAFLFFFVSFFLFRFFYFFLPFLYFQTFSSFFPPLLLILSVLSKCCESLVNRSSIQRDGRYVDGRMGFVARVKAFPFRRD